MLAGPPLTRVFPSFIPLDEADNEQDQDEQSDGAHEADEPSLGGDVHLSARHGCARREPGLGRCSYTFPGRKQTLKTTAE